MDLGLVLRMAAHLTELCDKFFPLIINLVAELFWKHSVVLFIIMVLK